jgi:O-antigen ligase
MGAEVAEHLRLKWGSGRPVPLDQLAQPRRRMSTNALMGMGLWLLLWLGYNTGPGYVMSPNFPASTMDFIHGVRAFFPMAAAWFAILLIFARSSRLVAWIMGPLGLMLLYAVLGMISSTTLSPDRMYASYYGINYLAMVLVLLAIAAVEDPIPDLRNVLRLTWIVGTILTLSLLGAIPFLGSWAISEAQTSPVGVMAYPRVREVLGMAGSRNTGFARYAAISALVALAGLLRKGNVFVRMLWGIVFATSIYALIIANGRTEILGFICGAMVIFLADRAKRTVSILIGIPAALLLGLWRFYSAFFLYFTRTGKFEYTLSGRTRAWAEGWQFIWESPWVGFGFQADRYFVKAHMHNAFLHVLVQAGFLGGSAILIGLAIVWFFIFKHFFVNPPSDRSLIPSEIPAVFAFVTFSSVTESTFAYFSATWLLSAPIVAYVMALHRHLQRERAKAAWEKLLNWRLATNHLHDDGSREGIAGVPRSVA